ncbi:MAG: hypothetical protein IJI05_03105 [Erysipelotrichaceae bacterium]|nr:hypothetical protein [Erysipelotrichaceae bacterium]
MDSRKPEKEEAAASVLQAVDRQTIEENGTFITTILYKPVKAVIIIAIAAVLLIALIRNIWAVLLGGFALALAAIVHFKMEDYKVVDVYDDALIIYADETGEKAARIPYEDIQEWSAVSENAASSAIMFKLTNGRVFYKNTFRTADAHKVLFKIMPEKESRQIQMQKNRETKLVFRNPFKKWFK